MNLLYRNNGFEFENEEAMRAAEIESALETVDMVIIVEDDVPYDQMSGLLLKAIDFIKNAFGKELSFSSYGGAQETELREVQLLRKISARFKQS